jgi:hypothetical protein
MSTYRRVGDWLVQRGFLTEEQREAALETQRTSRLRFGEVLVTMGFVTEHDITTCLSEQFEFPLVDPRDVKPSSEALRIISPTFALSRLVLPVRLTETELHAIIGDPLDLQATDKLNSALGRRLVLSIAEPTKLFEAIAHAYALPKGPRAIPEEAKISAAAAAHAFVEPVESGAPKRARRARAPKIVDQSDRRHLLAALATAPTTAPAFDLGA